jgi:hypothetical protein
MRFWRSKRAHRPPANPESRWPELLGQLVESPGDLRVVTGPDDGGSVCSDWVGAVVSVGGRSEYFPPLVEAVEDGLFHPGCRHKLIPFKREEGEAEALFCTKWALAAMLRRRSNGDGSASSRSDEGAEKSREDFRREYDLARQREQAGDTEQALHHCQTALRMLAATDLFGADQDGVARVLKGRMQTILRAQCDRAKPRLGGR